MKILFIAPLPPPVTGHSICSEVLLGGLRKSHGVSIVDLSKDSFKEGIDGFKRILQIIGILKSTIVKLKKTDAIYFTISESLAGNIKDLLIYLICFSRLPKMYIHLHGGTIKKELWDKHQLIYQVNKFFIKRMAGVIITGKSHLSIFDDFVPTKRIHIVPNFALDSLFVDEEVIAGKFKEERLRILYMSNLIPKKGYLELADAYIKMPSDLQNRIQLDFAGGFDSVEAQEAFLKKIAGFPRIRYHGITSGENKQKLFADAHVFCLPTSYREGQPLSILEAFASGCVVLTTGQSGIYDIFEDGINGFEIEATPQSIIETVSTIIQKRTELEAIARVNLATASARYRTEIYQDSLRRLLEASDTNSTIDNHCSTTQV